MESPPALNTTRRNAIDSTTRGGGDPVYTWHVARNKIAACTSDSTVLAGYEEFRRADDSTDWQVVSEITIHAAGNRVFRSSFESELGRGIHDA